MSNPEPQKQKRAYRHRVKCSECKKEIVAECQDAHARGNRSFRQRVSSPTPVRQRMKSFRQRLMSVRQHL